ncbi:hypothetical protein [Tabrizicola sp.]|uniref:hypothetical protein n=1 Tax=Tabrizicola sp. TaxID=2005166 RepID=UPI0025FB55F0|nr:hypothetical protein [Tabrizicola sp.]
MDQRVKILTLQSQLCEHIGRSHWAISVRIFGKGDFFRRLLNGADCRTSTADRAMQWFADNWPDDLAWPKDISRPAKSKRAA